MSSFDIGEGLQIISKHYYSFIVIESRAKNEIAVATRWYHKTKTKDNKITNDLNQYKACIITRQWQSKQLAYTRLKCLYMDRGQSARVTWKNHDKVPECRSELRAQIAMGKKLSLNLVVRFLITLYRLPEGNSSKR